MASIWTGLLAGALATVPMTLWELPFYRRHGMEGVLEWHENQATWAGILDRRAEELVLPGLLTHLGHGTVAAGILVLFLPAGLAIWATVLASVSFAWLLWIVTLALHGPITGLSALDHPQGSRPAWVSLVGHVIYGAALGVLLVVLPDL